MKILFLVPYPRDSAPSQRFRFEQYLGIMRDQNIQVDLRSFFDKKGWELLSLPGYSIAKVLAIFRGLMRRVAVLFGLGRYDYVFIHREAAPIGPPFFEWFTCKLASKRIIYDFDDAIWLTDRNDEGRLEKIVRWRSKVETICGYSYKVSAGNDYLADYARRHNRNVVVNPTTINTDLPRKAKKQNADAVTIGWTGSHSTLKYLAGLMPIIEKLKARYPQVRLLVIANRDPGYDRPAYQFKPWSAETEVDDLMNIDIGIMPLPDDPWSRGKCGFKALQFMALGIATIASPVGVNKVIVEHGTNGLLAESDEAWSKHLESLIINPDLRDRLGKAGASFVVANYSVRSNAGLFLSLFER